MVFVQKKYEGVAQALNKKYYDRDPAKYPHQRNGAKCYEKFRSMENRYKKEKVRERQHYGQYQQTGSAADTEVPDFVSTWPAYSHFYECCVEGNMADEDKQIGTAMIRCSALPGMPHHDPADQPGMRTQIERNAILLSLLESCCRCHVILFAVLSMLMPTRLCTAIVTESMRL